MALAASTTACACIGAVSAEKFKAVIYETAAKAAQKASPKRARENANNPTPPPVPPARRQIGITAAFSGVSRPALK